MCPNSEQSMEVCRPYWPSPSCTVVQKKYKLRTFCTEDEKPCLKPTKSTHLLRLILRSCICLRIGYQGCQRCHVWSNKCRSKLQIDVIKTWTRKRINAFFSYPVKIYRCMKNILIDSFWKQYNHQNTGPCSRHFQSSVGNKTMYWPSQQ